MANSAISAITRSSVQLTKKIKGVTNMKTNNVKNVKIEESLKGLVNEVVQEPVLDLSKRKPTLIKLGLDIGACRVKVSYQVSEQDPIQNIVFLNTIDRSIKDHKTGTKVTYNNDTILIGALSGYSNIKPKKMNYDALIQIVFTAVYKVYSQINNFDAQVEIYTMLPPNQYLESADNFRDLIRNFNGQTANVDGTIMTLNISNVYVDCEGVVLLNCFDILEIDDGVDQFLLIDVGSSTTDLVILERIDDGCALIDAITFSTGGKIMCNKVEHYLNNKFAGAAFETDKIERRLGYQYDGKMHKIDTVQEVYDSVIAELLDFIKRTINDVRMYKVILAGGASYMLKINDQFKNAIKNFTILDDNLLTFGNSIGVLK